MQDSNVEEGVIVHAVHGMQLSEGFIRKVEPNRYLGNLPGLEPCEGRSMEEVRWSLEQEAQTYYGNDVVVDIAPHRVAC